MADVTADSRERPGLVLDELRARDFGAAVLDLARLASLDTKLSVIAGAHPERAG